MEEGSVLPLWWRTLANEDFFVLTHCALNLTFEERNMYKKKTEKRRDLARLIRNKQNVDSNKDGQRSCSTLNQN